MKKDQKLTIVALSIIVLLTGCDKKNTSQPFLPKANIPKPATVTQPSAALPEISAGSSNGKGTPGAEQMPKQKHPQLVKLPDKPNPIGERLMRELSGLNPNEKAYSEKIRTLWREDLSRLSDDSVKSASNEAVAKGIILPSEMDSLKQPERNEDTPETALFFIVFASAAPGQDDLLLEFVEKRANTLPPTTTDIMIYGAIYAAVHEFTQTRGQNSYASFEKWEPLARSKNPIYRLLALKAAPVSVSKPAWDVDIDSKDFNRINAVPKMDFYLRYLEEKDPVILTEVIRALGNVPLPEARQAIEKFLAQQVQLGNENLVEAAEEALNTHKIISP